MSSVNNFRHMKGAEHVDALFNTLMNLGLQRNDDYYFSEKRHAYVENAEMRWGIAENNRLLRELIEVMKDIYDD